MDARNINVAHEVLSEDHELFLRYTDGEYTCTIKAQDTIELGWGNDIQINGNKWIDCNKICFMKIRKQGDDL